MPAKSEEQKKFFQLVLAYKEGEVDEDEVSQDVIDTAEDMSKEEIKKFATEPVEETVTEAQVRKIVRQELVEAGLRRGRGFRGKSEEKERERLSRLQNKSEEMGYETYFDPQEPSLTVMDDNRNELEATYSNTANSWYVKGRGTGGSFRGESFNGKRDKYVLRNYEDLFDKIR